MRRWQCYLQHAHFSFTDMEFSLAKAISTVSFSPNNFFSVPNPSKAVLPPLSVKGQADSNHYISKRFDWVSKLNQLKKWSSKLQSWHKASSRELEGGAALLPPPAASWICSRCNCSHLLSPQLHFQLLVPNLSFALAQALVPCHSKTVQGTKSAEGYWALPTSCQAAIFS